jgi:hypothetical protein
MKRPEEMTDEYLYRWFAETDPNRLEASIIGSGTQAT